MSSNDHLLAGPPPRTGFALRAVTALIKTAARPFLAWEPDGAIVIDLPTGESVRFGRADDDEARLIVNDYAVLARALRRGALGFAEAYLDGGIDSPDLAALFRFFLRNRARLGEAGPSVFRVRDGDRRAHRRRRNTRRGSRRNIAAHYDLGNDFFRQWLDADMVYSSGLFRDPGDSLDDAQKAKLDLVLDEADLAPGQRLLEIGCGWGALARRAARRGVDVTGITLSREQYDHAVAATAAEGLDTCRFELTDYRDADGTYDRIVSVEMVEAVGEVYWPTYFAALHDRLKSGGLAVIQAITIDEARFDAYRRNPDFIQRYIFPGGMLPTKTAIADEARAAGLVLERQRTFGLSYARTLRLWRERFEAAWPAIRPLGFDERFRRMWRYYLAYCEAGFLEGAIDVGVYTLRRP